MTVNHQVRGSIPRPIILPCQGNALRTHFYLGCQDRSRLRAAADSYGWPQSANRQARLILCGAEDTVVEQSLRARCIRD